MNITINMCDSRRDYPILAKGVKFIDKNQDYAKYGESAQVSQVTVSCIFKKKIVAYKFKVC